MPSPSRTSTLSRRSAVRLGSGSLATVVGLRGLSSVAAQDLASVDGNRALVRQVFDQAVNAGNVAIVDELYAAGFVDRSAKPGQLPGPAGIAQAITDLHARVPGLHVVVEALVAEGDLVATRANWRGTHPPKGTHLLGTTLHIFRIAGGQIIEEWSAGWEWLTKLERGAAGWEEVPYVSADEGL